MTNPFEALVKEAQAPTVEDQSEIEATLLAGLIALPGQASKIVSATRPEDYQFGLHRDFAKVVYPILTEGSHADLVVFKAKLPAPKPGDPDVDKRDGLIAFATKVFASTSSDVTPGKVEAYLSIFTERAKIRAAKALIVKAGEDLDAGEATPTGAISRVIEAFTDLDATRRLVGTYKSEGDDLPAYFASLKARQDPTRAYLGLNTGFPHLNNVANGFTPGLWVIGAAPSIGKTTLIKQLADQVVELNDRAVAVVFSYEQSRDELRVKTLSRLSGIENRDILRGRVDPGSTGWAKVEEAQKTFMKIAPRLYVVEADKTTTPDRIRLALTQIRRATKADGVVAFIDYLQIVPTEDDFKEARGKVDFLVSELRRLARDLDVTVVALSSVGRGAYDSVSMSAYKESGGVEYAADIGAILTFDKDKTKTTTVGRDEIGKWRRVFFDIVKNRNGERARITTRFYQANSRFVEADTENLPDEA